MDPTVTHRPETSSLIGPKRPHGLLIPNSSAVRAAQRTAKSRPRPTQRRQAGPGQTPTTAGILGPRRFPRATTSSGRKLGSYRRRLFGSGLGLPPRGRGDAQTPRNNGDVLIQNREDTYTDYWWQITSRGRKSLHIFAQFDCRKDESLNHSVCLLQTP